MTNWRITLLLLVIVGALGWYGLKNQMFTPVPEKSPWDREKPFEKVSRDQIDRFEISGKAGKIVLEKRIGPNVVVPWEMMEPMKFPASLEEIDNLKNKVLSMGIVSKDPKGNPKELDLEPPAKYVRFITGTQDHRLKIGKKTPWDGGYFAQIEGRPEVFTIETDLVEQIDKPLDDYRFKSIFDFPAKDAVAVEFKKPGETIACEKTGDDWTITSPRRAKGGKDEIESYLNYMARQRMSRYVDDHASPKALAENGLAESKEFPAWKVTVKFSNRDPWVFTMGKNVSGSAEYHYTTVSTHPDIIGTIFVRTDEIVKSLENFLPDQRIPAPDKEWTRIGLEHTPSPFALKREGKEWAFDGGAFPTRKTDEAAAIKLVHQVSELRFREFAKDVREKAKDAKDPKDKERDAAFQPIVEATASNLKKFGIADANAPSITVTYANGASDRLVFGKPDERFLPILKEGEEVVVLIDKKFAEVLNTSYLDLRERALTDLWADGAARITLTFKNGRKLTFKPTPANSWVEESDASKRDYPAARELVRKLAKLEAAQYLTIDGADWAKHGLAEPEATVQVLYMAPTIQDPSRTCTLSIGEMLSDEGRYARLEEDARAHLFTISKKLSDMILKDLTSPADEPPGKK